jgi:subtilisin family serine protease
LNTTNDQTEHATAVAEIMISDSNNYPGIVPNAKLYSVGLSKVGFYQAVEWLLQSGTHVINMSARLSTTGEYSASDKWVDHIAHNHSVHFVKSAGNSGDKVSSPGLAYNAITVGAINDGNTIEWDNDVAYTYTAFNEVISSGITPANKPDVMAPGVLIKTASFPTAYFSDGYAVTGTSFAAPHVTGVVAQLIQQYPSLAVLQDLMKAMLTAAVRHDIFRYTSAQTIGFEKYGAGVIDARACSEISYRGTFVSSAFTAAQNNIPKTYTFNVTSADNRIRVSLAWLKSIWFSSAPPHPSDAVPSTNAPIANLDLAIIDPNGNELPLNAFINYDSNTNLAIIEFDPDVYGIGTYTVEVWIRNSTGAPTYFGLAWWANRN